LIRGQARGRVTDDGIADRRAHEHVEVRIAAEALRADIERRGKARDRRGRAAHVDRDVVGVDRDRREDEVVRQDRRLIGRGAMNRELTDRECGRRDHVVAGTSVKHGGDQRAGLILETRFAGAVGDLIVEDVALERVADHRRAGLHGNLAGEHEHVGRRALIATTTADSGDRDQREQRAAHGRTLHGAC
jgi:hypothetical protein